MDFVAIDVETANADMASICQVGVVRFVHGTPSDEWTTYVDPDDYFDPVNVSIHGIDEATVRSAPKLPQIAGILQSHLEQAVVVCHTSFDRLALHQAAERHGFELPECTWLDSARVARRTWDSCAWKGYGLESLCSMLGYQFRHHHALDDARAVAHVLLAAIRESGIDLHGWLQRVRQPIDPSTASSKNVNREGNPEGALYGEVLVFTGALEMPRREAADLAAAVGCRVASGITAQTTMLVVGDQDVSRLVGHDKSSKHRKAEELIRQGISIRILRETDFKELLTLSA